jgi:AraC-like DNA-binding protein
VRNARILLDVPGLRVADVSCDGHHLGWSAEEAVGGPAFVVVRSGRFRRRAEGRESVIDSRTAYLQRPGSVQQVAHPWGGDACTVIDAPMEGLDELAQRAADLPDGLGVSVRALVDHRTLVARSRNGADEFELTERAMVLVGRLVEMLEAGPFRPHRQASGPRARRLAEQVREALHEDIDRRLDEMARTFGVSVFHLSRTFRSVMSVSLTRYRRQLRLERALDRLEMGHADLARLAAELGFADQAHFTRVARAEAAATPAELRALLSP